MRLSNSYAILLILFLFILLSSRIFASSIDNESVVKLPGRALEIDNSSRTDNTTGLFYTAQLFKERACRTFNIKSYISLVEKNNIDLKIAFKKYKISLLSFAQTLRGYSWNVNFGASAVETFNGKPSFTAQAGFNFSKVIYDGGIGSILLQEEKIVDDLAREKLINKNDIVVLAAISAYSAKLYSQELAKLLREQLEEEKELFKQVKGVYTKGDGISQYDYLTEKRDILDLELALLRELSKSRKTDLEFRYLGGIYSKEPIKLERFDINYEVYLPELQKRALVNNSSVKQDRYAYERELLGFEEKRRKSFPLISVSGGAGLSHTMGQGGNKNLYYSAGVYLKYPLFDGGIRKIELEKQKLKIINSRMRVKKDSEMVAKKLSLLFEDFRFYKKEESFLKNIVAIDKKRVEIAKMKYLKGVGNFKSLRDAWRDLIKDKERVLKDYIMKNKILLDMLIVAGEKL